MNKIKRNKKTNDIDFTFIAHYPLIIRYLLFIILFISLCQPTVAQNNTYPLPDSLTRLLNENNKHDLQQLKSLNSAVEALFETFHHHEAIPYIDEMNNLAENLNNNHFKALSQYYLGVCHCKHINKNVVITH